VQKREKLKRSKIINIHSYIYQFHHSNWWKLQLCCRANSKFVDISL